jgi:DNA-binding CsgD family transcriptional regulator
VSLDEATYSHSMSGPSTHADAADEPLASPFPLIVISLPDQRVLSANRPAESWMGLTRSELIDRRAQDLVAPAEAQHVTSALAALASGALDSYRAHCSLVGRRGPIPVWMWVRSVPSSHGAIAVMIVLPVGPTDPVHLSARNLMGPLADLATGTMDGSGQVTSMSCADPGILDSHDDCADGSWHLASQVHPDDQARLWAALKRFRTERDDVMIVIDVRHALRGWLETVCHLFVTGAGDPGAALGFMLIEGTVRAPGAGRIADLERTLGRIAADADSARMALLPLSPCDEWQPSALSSLTDRQREIVTRLLAGSRVSTIASELFVSRSTIRNHLAAVYRACQVHSQAELIEMLRRA